MGQQIEAVFENGVFRPLQQVHLPEHYHVTFELPAPDGTDFVAQNGSPAEEIEIDEEVGYQPLPLRHCQVIRVAVKQTGELAPVPYPVEEAEVGIPEELEQP